MLDDVLSKLLEEEIDLLRAVHWAARGVMRYDGVDQKRGAEYYAQLRDAVYAVNDFDHSGGD